METKIFSLVTIGFFGLFAFLGGAYNSGVTQYLQDRQQPIAFSHKIHAGDKKIECTFCHEHAANSRHATIPSVKKCMGCHENIKTDSDEVKKILNYWKGNPLSVDAAKYENDLRQGTIPAEIKEHYAMSANAMVKIDNGKMEIVDLNKKFTVKKETTQQNQQQLKTTSDEGIPWSRIHWVPDHVYFSHKRHIKAGLDCTECHGKIQYMETVRKIPSMKMGWCVQCHTYKMENGTKIKTKTADGKEQIETREVSKTLLDCWTCHK